MPFLQKGTFGILFICKLHAKGVPNLNKIHFSIPFDTVIWLCPKLGMPIFRFVKIKANYKSAERLIGAILMDDHNDWSCRSIVFTMDEYLEREVAIKKHIKLLVA